METTATPYKVFWTNHGYHSAETFEDVRSAVSYGKSKCFEFSVSQGSELVAAWGPISGLRFYDKAAETAYYATTPAPFSGGPGSATVYNSAWQCSPRCQGTKENACMIAVNRSKGGAR